MVVLVLLAASCAGTPAGDSQRLDGRILVWHNWPGVEGVALQQLLDGFDAIQPGLTVATEYVPTERFREEFTSRASAGFGPDVIVGIEDDLVRDLVDAGAIASLDSLDIDVTALSPSMVEALRLGGQRVALPFSAYTNVLYYDKRAVAAPPAHIDGLLAEAKAGRKVAIPVDFYNAFWGVSAFGGRLFDADGRVVLDQGGMVDWLKWLLKAQDEPNVILSADPEDLVSLFIRGGAAYLVGSSFELPYLQRQMGAGNVGVAALPMATREAQPIVELEVIAVNRYTAQSDAVSKLIAYLLSRPQQRKLALSNLGRIPANAQVALDPRLAPEAAALAGQARVGMLVTLPTAQAEDRISDRGTLYYAKTLDGLLSPEQAVRQLTSEANAYLAP